MLGNQDVMATIAVKDIEAARKFYEGTLGLAPQETGEPQVLSYRSGQATVLVYVSEFAGTNHATSATWVVGEELDSIVKTLRGKGVAFEHYTMPDTELEGDIHVSGSTRVAWFKDPDGNILSVVNG